MVLSTFQYWLKTFNSAVKTKSHSSKVHWEKKQKKGGKEGDKGTVDSLLKPLEQEEIC